MPFESFSDLPPEKKKEIKSVCESFNSDFSLGNCPLIEKYLAEYSGLPQDWLLKELLSAELQNIISKNETIRLADFEKRFPDQIDIVRELCFKFASSGDDFDVNSLHSTDRGKEEGTADTTLQKHSKKQTRKNNKSRRRFGDYELLHVIKSGGMGTVYKAKHVKLERIVALKMIRSGLLATQEDIRRFMIEAKAAARLDHPGIVPVYEIGTKENQHYFSMAYIDGESLADLLSSSLPEQKRSARIMAKVADAIHFAHTQNIIHRDLKPGNILLSSDDEPHVADFGLAKRLDVEDGASMTGQLLGTLGYMPPEQAGGSPGDIGPAADIYSMGATLYALLTGRPPFQSAQLWETINQIKEQPPVSPRELNLAVDQDLETICLRCLEKEPDKRYATAAELADDIKRYLRNEPIQARPIGRTERAWRLCKRNPIVSGLIFAVFLTLIAGTIISGSFAIEANNRANAEAIALQSEQKAKQAETEEKNKAIYARNQLSIALEKANQQVYVSGITLAGYKWNAGTISGLPELIASAPQEHRHWEWKYLANEMNFELPRMRGHTDAVACVAYSPDGKRVISGSWDKTIRVWEAATGKPLKILKGHTSQVNCVAFSRDGKKIASGSFDKTIRIWDVETGKELVKLKGHRLSVTGVAFSPDGKQIVSSSYDGTVRLWDLYSAKMIHTLKGHEKGVLCVAISPDGVLAASGGQDEIIILWNLKTGENIRSWKGHVQPGERRAHSGIYGVTCLSFSPDGRTIVSGGYDKKVRVQTTGPRMNQTPQSVKISDKKLRERYLSMLQDIKKSRLINTKHTGFILSVAYSPDGKRIVSSGGDKTIIISDTVFTSKSRTIKSHWSWVTSVAFSPDGNRLVSGSIDKTIKIHKISDDKSAKRNIKEHEDQTTCISFSPDGKWLASSGLNYPIKLRNNQTGQILGQIEGHGTNSKLNNLPSVSSFVFSPDGEMIASAGWDLTVRVWDTQTKKELHKFEGHTKHVTSVAVSPDSHSIASSSNNGTVRIWRLKSAKQTQLLKKHQGEITTVAYSPDGTMLATAGRDKKLILWDTLTWQVLRTLNGHTGAINHLSFSADGKRIISGSEDRSIRIWNPATGQEVKKLIGHSDSVTSVIYSPDRKRLFSGSKDSTVRIWLPETGQELLQLPAEGPVSRITVSPDGRFLAASILTMSIISMKNKAVAITIWDAGSYKPLPVKQ